MSSTIPATSGIYRIRCTIADKCYIGSAENLLKRSREHLHALRHNKHHSITLQRAFNKYGESAFVFEVLELVFVPFLIAREQYWLDTLLPFGTRGYNINRIAGSRLGMEVSPETREKLRLANLGRKDSIETIRKRAEAGKHRTQSAETKEKVRLIRLGTMRSLESRERSRISHIGKTDSPETIEKKRLALTGRPVSAKTREKLRSKMSDAKSSSMQTLIVTAPDGTEHIVIGVGKFCKEHGLNHSALIQVARGKARHHKGWTACYP